MPKIAIPVFPGSNCDKDIHYVLNNAFKVDCDYIWHKKDSINGYDAIIIPGGFSFGDRLRAGIIAAHSPIIKEVKRLGHEGIPIIGICNGFQILVESGLLPGALIMNNSLKFVCDWTKIQIKNTNTPFTSKFKDNEIIKIPIAHGEGRYIVNSSQLKDIKKRNQIVFSYYDSDPNGSLEYIAGVCNESRNIVGMMPHPERSCQKELKPFGLSSDALRIFESLINYIRKCS